MMILDSDSLLTNLFYESGVNSHDSWIGRFLAATFDSNEEVAVAQ